MSGVFKRLKCIFTIWFYGAFFLLGGVKLNAVLDDAAFKQEYRQVEVLPAKWHGWFNNQEQLDALFAKIRPKVIIELGSFLGLSTKYMAKKLSAGGKLYAIDHWLGSAEHQGRCDVKDLLPTLYQQFLSNMLHESLEDIVIPLRMTTIEAHSYLLSIRADLIYVDASHDEDSVYTDLLLYYPLLSAKGCLCGDDWQWASVNRAVRRFASDFNLTIESKRNFWSLISKR